MEKKTQYIILKTYVNNWNFFLENAWTYQHNDDFNATWDVPIGISFDESITMVFNLFPYMCTILFIFYKVQVIVFNNIT